jgi:hypothetical protein
MKSIAERERERDAPDNERNCIEEWARKSY